MTRDELLGLMRKAGFCEVQLSYELAIERFAALVSEAAVAPYLQRAQEAEGMAECMADVRTDLIGAGVIPADTAPAFVADATITAIQKLRSEVCKAKNEGEAALKKQREAVEDAAEEWAWHVEVDNAAYTLLQTMKDAMDAARGKA